MIGKWTGRASVVEFLWYLQRQFVRLMGLLILLPFLALLGLLGKIMKLPGFLSLFFTDFLRWR
jgi:hypothetical protein